MLELAAGTGSILTLNGGSSSLKFAVFSVGAPLGLILSGQIERIGRKGATLSVRRNDGSKLQLPVDATHHEGAADILIAWLAGQTFSPLIAIGHRLVYGGGAHLSPALVTPSLLAELRGFCPFYPEHLPTEIALIDACSRAFPELPQVACFDTSFHSALPRVAYLLPLPRRLAEKGVRKYGFHGLSYTFVLTELARVAGAQAARGRLIFAHLGSGASLAAVRDGVCIDTSMGLTPTGGLPMGTRTGDLDPGVLQYLVRSEGMSIEQVDRMLNHESGLLGISESSADMRDLLTEEKTDSRAADAVALFCYQVRKWIGAYAAALGGLDTLVFSGGIGEHAPEVRARICAELGFLGLVLDEPCNAASASVISAASSRIIVRVITTDEESVIGEAVRKALS